jgi:hypothetical protein
VDSHTNAAGKAELEGAKSSLSLFSFLIEFALQFCDALAVQRESVFPGHLLDFLRAAYFANVAHRAFKARFKTPSKVH